MVSSDGPGQVASQATSEVAAAMEAVPSEAWSGLVEAILGAGTVATYGVGREGLVMRAFCMRLGHLGLDAHVVGDMTTPPIGPDDLLVVSAGPGWFSTVEALMGVAAQAGARTLALTGKGEGRCAAIADVAVVLPGQTMADDDAGHEATIPSVLPLGSAYEITLLLFLDVAVAELVRRTGQSMGNLRSRHTNLE